MDTYSVAAPTGAYQYVNTDPSSPYYMWLYKLGSSAHGEVEHIYGDGRTDWVPAGTKNESATWVPPAGASPNTFVTGGVVGEPVAHAPQTNSGGGSTGGGVNGGVGSGGTPPTPPSQFDTLQAQVNALSNTLSGYVSNGSISYQNAEAFESQINALQASMNAAVQNGSLTTSQEQELDKTIGAEENVMGGYEVNGLQNQLAGYQKTGSITSAQKEDFEGSVAKAEATLNSATYMDGNEKQQELTKLSYLGQQADSLPAPTPNPTGGGATPPITVLGGGGNGTSGSSGNGTGGTGTGTSSGGSTDGNNNGTGGTVDGTNGLVGSTGGTASSDGSSGSSSTNASSSPSGGTYTVQHGDNMWNIAQANGMTLEQLEALNPQIKNPSLIFAGQQINISGGSAAAASTDGSSSSTTSTSTTDASSGANYTVKHGDTMWGIAEAHGMTLSQLEALNPQVSNPSMIYPNQQINLGGGSAAAASSSTATTDSFNFPQSSTYQGSQSDVHTTSSLTSQEGGSTTGNESHDPTQNMIEAATKTNTDPLKINDEKSHLV
jgi:LysM repeat protein